MKKPLWILHFLIFMVTSGVALFIFFVQANNLNILTQDDTFTYDEILVDKPYSMVDYEGPETYIIMDRNLGAEEVYTGINNTDTYGFYYQWGNNFGLQTLGTLSSDQVADRNTHRVDARPYGPSNPFYSGIFIKASGKNDWARNANDNLWGHKSGTVEDMQGPCPDGWHVPSIYEWNDVVDYWTNGDGNGTMNLNSFVSYFKLPKAGYRARSTSDLNNQGTEARYWTSTPTGQIAYMLEFSGRLNSLATTNRVDAQPIRCFKNPLICEEGMHQEGIGCVSNFASGNCRQLSGLTNGVYTGVNDLISIEYIGSKWNVPVCDAVCDAGYEYSGYNCEIIILDCGPGMHQEMTGCVSNYRTGYCAQVKSLRHGHYTGLNDIISIEWIDGERITPECTIVCDEGYELSGGYCMGDPLSIIFETYSGTKVASITGIVEGTDISSMRPSSDPKWKNHMFLGWFDGNDERFEFEGTILWESITLYAKFAEFEDIVYSGNLNGDDITITLMDRNMGATATGVGMSATSGSYGYYYQWGNNHGFYGIGDLTGKVKVHNVGIYGPLNGFYGKTFIISNDLWSDTYNYNLWGGSGDALANSYDNGNLRFNRQGPCPKGYHIPSIKEWYTLLSLYLGNNGYSDETGFPSSVGTSSGADFFLAKVGIDEFLSTFNIPVAGRILGSYSYQRYATYNADKNVAHFWTSTPHYDNKNAFGAEAQVGNKGVAISNPKLNIGGWPAVLVSAYPVRCFKNDDDHTITWVDDDGTVLEIDDDVYEGEVPEYYGEIPTKADDANYTYEFSGWNVEVVAATQDTVYTAVYLSIPRRVYTVTWQNYDGTILEYDTGVVKGSIPEYNGSTPTKPSDSGYNYIFVGWMPELTGIEDDMFYTAVFSGEEIGCDIGYHKEDGECTGDTKYLPCIQTGAPANAIYLTGDVLVYRDGTGRTDSDSCMWSCDENYHEQDDVCVLDAYILDFISSGGNLVPSRIVDYGSTIILPGTDRTGYHFSGWYTKSGYFVGMSGATFVYDITGDITLYARWEANTGTRYTVRHLLQNADDDLYVELLSGQQTLQGTTDTLTQATANYYTGFHSKEINQIPISGDETTIVDIYYDRDIYMVSIDLNGGMGVSEVTGKYGQTLSQPEISRSGYTLKKYVPNFPSTMPLNGTSTRVVWTLTSGAVSIKIVPLTGDEFNFGSVVASNRVQILTGYLGENTFQLEDSRGENSGYYVTLSMSTLDSVSTSNSIPRSNIQLRSHGVTTITGTQAAQVGISQQLLSWTTMDNTVLYLTRPDIVVEDDPLIGTYGDNLEFKVLVPPYTYPDRYRAVITYTLYDNDDE